MSDHLAVRLHQVLVGYLSRLPGDRIIFSFDDAYIEDDNRPTLSLSFYDQLKELLVSQRPTQRKAPPFFANLLPEGHLRSYIAEKGHINPDADFDLLALLGKDLPGAVEIEKTEVGNTLENNQGLEIEAPMADDVLRFSLAGVQLKFSALLKPRGGLTIPAHGAGGDWIIKLPSSHFHHVPENEHAMMRLAQLSGLDVPEVRLIEFDSIKGLTLFPQFKGQKVLAVKRFDRDHQNKIHIEDLAQVFSVYPWDKYNKVSYNNIAKRLRLYLEEGAVEEFIKRLVFNLIIGNGDYHLKNISLIYPDSIKPKLSPAYDLLSTRIYLNDDTMALSLYGEKHRGKIDDRIWRKLSSDLELPFEYVKNIIDQFQNSVQEKWKSQSFGLSDSLYDEIDRQIF